jgi:hypothetical protein
VRHPDPAVERIGFDPVQVTGRENSFTASMGCKILRPKGFPGIRRKKATLDNTASIPKINSSKICFYFHYIINIKWKKKILGNF